MASKTTLVPLAAMMAGKAELPYKKRLELHKERITAGCATDTRQWVASVAMNRQRPDQRGLTFMAMVIEIAAEGTLDKYSPFLPSDDDRETAKEIAAGNHPTLRYYATLAYGYAYMSPKDQAAMQRKVKFYMEIEDPARERECYNKLCDLNPAMAAALRIRWRRANGLPDEDELPVTQEEKLAAMMSRALEVGVTRTAAVPIFGDNDPFGGVSFGMDAEEESDEAIVI